MDTAVLGDVAASAKSAAKAMAGRMGTDLSAIPFILSKKRLPLRSQGPEGRPMLARPVRAGNPNAASAKPRRGGTLSRPARSQAKIGDCPGFSEHTVSPVEMQATITNLCRRGR
jgi:hypothetical protein